MQVPLNDSMIEWVRALFAAGRTISEIRLVTGLPLVICERVVGGHKVDWPKLVTRVGIDGSAVLVRCL